MLYMVLKATLSGIIIMAVSEIAKRSPALGGLLASLPLVSVLALIWLWRDTSDTARIAAQSEATFWYVLPSLPMFLLLPLMLRQGISFWLALSIGCVVTAVLYFIAASIATHFGVRL